MDKRKKLTPKAKEPVRIRFKELQNGNQSIYFDTYRNGKRVYDFPKLYIVPEKTDADKNKNRETLSLANKIKAQKILKIYSNETGFAANSMKQTANFIDYIRKLADKKRTDGIRGVYQNYMGLIKHLTCYRGDKISFKHITREYCSGFNEYLKIATNGTYKFRLSETYPSGILSAGSQHGYSRLLSVTLNCAVYEGIIHSNPMKNLSRYERTKLPESNREYLTLDEIRQLVKFPCVKPIVKLAFLFACFSGLRFSDIKALCWGDIHTDNIGEKIIKFTQQKTGKHEFLQISNEALKFLPIRNEAKDNEKIFILSGNYYTNQLLKSWALTAGIQKRVTFHVGRHTNATLLLSLGVPIETVSKLLGHSSIKTTQIYAKVIDSNKRAAVSKLNGLID